MDDNSVPYEEVGQNQLIELAKHILLFDKNVPIILGEEGAGKSVLCYRLSQALKRHFTAGLIEIHPGVQGAHLSERILDAFQLKVVEEALPTEAEDMISFLAANHASPILLVVDDAHYLSGVQVQFLQQCLEMAQQVDLPMRMILLGEEQLAETVAIHFDDDQYRVMHIEPLTVESVKGWMAYRRQSGEKGSTPILSERRLKNLVRQSGGNFGQLERLIELKNRGAMPIQLSSLLQLNEVRPIFLISLISVVGLALLLIFVEQSQKVLMQSRADRQADKEWGQEPQPIHADAFQRDLQDTESVAVGSEPLEQAPNVMSQEDGFAELQLPTIATLTPLDNIQEETIVVDLQPLGPLTTERHAGPTIPILLRSDPKKEADESTNTSAAEILPAAPKPKLELKSPLTSASGFAVNGPEVFQQRRANNFALQVFAADTAESVYRFLRRFRLPKNTSYYYFLKGEKLWYAVVIGDYESFQLAADDAKKLSKELQKLGPFPRKNSEIQQKVAAARNFIN